jgi:hypothetical protein
LLCKDIESGRWVLIENQLERTDHSHLGQLLTYASGLEAVTIVRIAARFTEEHRSTLDWLNKITNESFHFFGLEVELWRIGSSAPAPKFNIVSKPNEWSRSVAKGADQVTTESETIREKYWKAFNRWSGLPKAHARRGKIVGRIVAGLCGWAEQYVAERGNKDYDDGG